MMFVVPNVVTVSSICMLNYSILRLVYFLDCLVWINQANELLLHSKHEVEKSLAWTSPWLPSKFKDERITRWVTMRQNETKTITEYTAVNLKRYFLQTNDCPGWSVISPDMTRIPTCSQVQYNLKGITHH